MDLKPVVMSPLAYASDLFDRISAAAASIRRILDAHQSRAAQVLIVGPDLAFQIVDVEHAVAAVIVKRAYADSTQNRWTTRFPVGDVPAFVDH